MHSSVSAANFGAVGPLLASLPDLSRPTSTPPAEDLPIRNATTAVPAFPRCEFPPFAQARRQAETRSR